MLGSLVKTCHSSNLLVKSGMGTTARSQSGVSREVWKIHALTQPLKQKANKNKLMSAPPSTVMFNQRFSLLYLSPALNPASWKKEIIDAAVAEGLINTCL